MFIAQHDLNIIIEPTHNSTFCSNRNSSNIDLTLAKGSIRRRVSDWRVEENWTSSDYRVLTFNITATTTSPPLETQFQARYKTKLRNYSKFNAKLAKNLSNLAEVENNAENIDNFA